MKTYKVYEAISGETQKILAESPRAAVCIFLYQQTEVNLKNKSWDWSFEVTLDR